MLVKIKCNLCGFTEETTGSSMGVINDKDFWGNHNCSNGEMGTMYLSDSGFNHIIEKYEKK